MQGNPGGGTEKPPTPPLRTPHPTIYLVTRVDRAVIDPDQGVVDLLDSIGFQW